MYKKLDGSWKLVCRVLGLALALSLVGGNATADPPPGPYNVILIVADDLPTQCTTLLSV